MKTTVEPLEGNKIKLSVQVDDAEFESALDEAFRRIAREVRIPGFRPGKAPRRVLEAHIGKDSARQEALRQSLPDFYTQAVGVTDIDPIAQPEIDITSDGVTGPVAFDAVVEVRPKVSVAGYDGLQVTLPAVEVPESDIDAQVDRLRNAYAELREVDRPAIDGDNVTIDVTGAVDGEPSEELSADDFVYEVGSGAAIEEMDANLRGAKVGDILQFDGEVPDEGRASFRVLVKAVKEKVLPEVTDEWASEASEFSTVEELRTDIRTRLEAVRRVQASFALRDGTLAELVKLVSEEPPEALVNGEVERQLHNLGHRLEAQGADLGQYLAATGQDQQQLIDEVRTAAVDAVKADLALRGVADAEGIDIDDEDVDKEIAQLAERYQMKPARLRREFERGGQLPALRSDVRKAKALAWLVEHVATVDEEGRPIDRSQLQPTTGDDVDTGEQTSDPDETTAEVAP